MFDEVFDKCWNTSGFVQVFHNVSAGWSIGCEHEKAYGILGSCHLLEVSKIRGAVRYLLEVIDVKLYISSAGHSQQMKDLMNNVSSS